MSKCKVLLLGGIGSGKSSVARMLSERGAEVIEADHIGHRVLEDEEVVGRIEAEWPSTVSGGRVDRSKLASVVFGDPIELRRLEVITHPRIRSAIAARVESSTARIVIVEMPLLEDLVEGEWVRVLVDASETRRIDRLCDRGLDQIDARARMDVQPAAAEYREAADIVITNDGTWAELERQVEALHKRLEGSCCYGDRRTTDGDRGNLGSPE
jgi:dephospho-CoA kinase